MAKPDASDEQKKFDVQHVAEEVFSSEQREDIWALIVVLGIFLLSVAFPAQVHYFFSSMLYLF